MSATSGGSTSEADLLILEAAASGRQLSEDELQRVLTHVARAGFDPAPTARVGGRLAGLVWRGHRLAGSDRLPSAEVHYLRHVVANAEWPRGTTLRGYLESIGLAILDARSGVVTSRYQGAWQLAALCHSGSWRGPDGSEWILVDYRVDIGHWVTAFQPAAGLQELHSPRRSDLRWLRHPQ